MRSILDEVYTYAFHARSISDALAAQLVDALPGCLLDLFAAARGAACKAHAVYFTCGIINAKSGGCQADCSFCAQSRHHRGNAPVYPLVSTDTLLKRAEELAATQVDRMGIVTSGVSPSQQDVDRLCEAASLITKRVGIKLCASFGRLGREQGIALRQAGFSRYHHNLETSASYSLEVCTTHAHSLRLETVENAKAAGLQVCSGGIFGLGETWAHRIELVCALRELDVDSIPVNFLMPIKGTPLEERPLLSPEDALAIIAIIRLMHPARDVVICGGRDLVLQEWGNLVFSAGASGIMVGNYLTVQGRSLDADIAMLKTLGIRP